MGWYVYILCCGDGTLYTGITDDMERRLEHHRSGKGAKYTRGRGPLELVYTETQPDKSAALRREYAIKQMDRRTKQNLIARARQDMTVAEQDRLATGQCPADGLMPQDKYRKVK